MLFRRHSMQAGLMQLGALTLALASGACSTSTLPADTPGMQLLPADEMQSTRPALANNELDEQLALQGTEPASADDAPGMQPAPADDAPGVQPAPVSGEPSGPGSSHDQPVPAALVDLADPASAYLKAVGQIGTSCTGAFVKTSTDDAAPAYLLTAGHCALGKASFGPAEAQVVMMNRELDGEELPIVFAGLGSGSVHVQPRRVAYATMKGMDIALLELSRTIGQLKAAGIVPLPLANASPAQGDEIEIAGIPNEYDGGEYDMKVLRRARCMSDRRADVVESHWYFRKLHAGRCQGLGPGASGAPAIDAAGRVFGVFSTHFDAQHADSLCFQNAPCEVGQGSLERGVPQSFYSNDIVGLAACFDAKGVLALGSASCPLDPGVQPELEQPAGSLIRASQAGGVANTWGVSLTSTTLTSYRYKVGSLATLDCSDERGYSAPLPLSDLRVSHEPLPASDGLYGMCIVASADDAMPAQAFAHANLVVQHVRSVQEPLAGLEPKNISPGQALDLAYAILPHFEQHARAHGADLSVTYDPGQPTHAVALEGRHWRISLGFGFFKPDLTPPDVAATIICHELGHLLGGFPFKISDGAPWQAKDFELYGTVSATEGQADYFATKECLFRYWQAQPSQNALARSRVEPYEKELCDTAWPDESSRDLCYRAAGAAEAFGAWRRSGNEPIPALDTPSTNEVSATDYVGYPAKDGTQCRVDTLFQGALCTTKARGTSIPGVIPPYERLATIDPAVEKAAEPDACIEGLGARPRCWFKPNTVEFDCSEFPPHLHRCAVVDGQSAIQACTRSGIETYACMGGGTCVLDETDFPSCAPSAAGSQSAP